VTGTGLRSAPVRELRRPFCLGLRAAFELGEPAFFSSVGDPIARRLSGIVLGQLSCDLALNLIVHVTHRNTP